MAVAHVDKVGDLFSRIGIDDAAELRRLAGRSFQEASLIDFDADRNSFDAGLGGNYFSRVVRLKFVDATLVQQTGENVSHVVREAMVARHDLIHIRQRACCSTRLRGSLDPVPWKIRNQRSESFYTLLVILSSIMSHAGNLVVCSRASERFAVHGLPDCALYEIGSAKPHEGRALDHNDHVGERGKISSAGYALAHHGGDLRNLQEMAHHRVVEEYAAASILTRKHIGLVGKIHARGID